MNITIFGGSGFIGSHVVDELISLGYNVINFDCRARKNDPAKYVYGDILNLNDVLQATKNTDIVYNFAGYAQLDNKHTKAIDTIKLNIEGNDNILRACVKNKVKKYIYASTLYVNSAKGGFYKCSKQAAENYIEEYNKKYNLNYNILRFGTIYGPRATNDNSIKKYITQALNGEIIATDNLESLREYIHVIDAAKLSVKAIDKKYDNQTLIISGQHIRTYRQLLNTISEIVGDVKITFNTKVKDDDHYSYTPYSIKPQPRKILLDSYIDLGQGLLQCVEEVNAQIQNNEKPVAEVCVNFRKKTQNTRLDSGAGAGKKSRC